MFICKKCGSHYLRESDAVKCNNITLEEPIVNLGRVLIDNSYKTETSIRCYAIRKNGHCISYSFEWVDPELHRWEHVYVINNNSALIDKFGEQIKFLL